MKYQTIGLALASLAAFATSAHATLAYDISSRAGGWTIYTFTDGTGSWILPAHSGNVEVLVVGGGGATGMYSGGGGGGGFLEWSGSMEAGMVSVEVGSGGLGGNYRDDSGEYPNSTRAPSGGQSSFADLTAYGGQGGIFVWTAPGAGYGWGGASGTNNTDSVGGLVADLPDGDYGSGSGVGVKGTLGVSASGGAGLSSAITGTLSWYGGGGGALVDGAGGLGGGGAGGNPPEAGTANTGGGGGAGWGIDGVDGGSGVVIVAFQAIPEPGSLLTLGCLVGSGLVLRRRRNGCGAR